jgi:SAM-dependent methyltransferase
MYEILKSILHRIRYLFEHLVLTAFYGLVHKIKCPYCNWSGWKFLPAGAAHTPNRLCPRCGSLERYRMLLLYLQMYNVFDGPLHILDMAPNGCFTNYVQKIDHITYISSDLTSPTAMVWSDITRMAMADNSLDLIVCPHILEHVPDDGSAFSELGRILRPSGFGLLMVPVTGMETYEVPGSLLADNEKLYGQHDHVRRYGMDICTRMRSAGLEVEILDMFQLFGDESCRKYGLYGDDRYYFKFTK